MRQRKAAVPPPRRVSSSRVSPSVFVLRLLPLLFVLLSVDAQHCYSCAGTCHSEPCNCHMGKCPSSSCYIERKPTEVLGVWRITKGCMRNPSRLHKGCDYDHFSDHVLCTCDGDFCNDSIYIRPQMRRNVSCRFCPERDPDCGRTCQGQWCHEDTTTGAAGCGFGPPSLPFFHKGPELLYFRHKLCVTISRGAALPRRHCICNTNNCNQYTKWRMHTGGEGQLRLRHVIHSNVDEELKLHECVSCELSTGDAAVTAQCKQRYCHGHFCTLATQRIYPSNNGGQRVAQPLIIERQGCLNIQLGCTHKWMSNEEEELVCACAGHHCNRDHLSASASPLVPFLFLLLLSFSF